MQQLLSESLSRYECNNKPEDNSPTIHIIITSCLEFIDKCFSRKRQIEYMEKNNIPLSYHTLWDFMKFAQEFEIIFKTPMSDFTSRLLTNDRNRAIGGEQQSKTKGEKNDKTLYKDFDEFFQELVKDDKSKEYTHGNIIRKFHKKYPQGCQPKKRKLYDRIKDLKAKI